MFLFFFFPFFFPSFIHIGKNLPGVRWENYSCWAFCLDPSIPRNGPCYSDGDRGSRKDASLQQSLLRGWGDASLRVCVHMCVCVCVCMCRGRMGAPQMVTFHVLSWLWHSHGATQAATNAWTRSIATTSPGVLFTVGMFLPACCRVHLSPFVLLLGRRGSK